jgi:hypothetical protein
MRCKPSESVCTADRQRTLNLARQGQALRVLRSLDVNPAGGRAKNPAAKRESWLL